MQDYAKRMIYYILLFVDNNKKSPKKQKKRKRKKTVNSGRLANKAFKSNPVPSKQ